MKATKGIKLQPKPTKAKTAEMLDKELKNLQMAGRVTQMMVQQLMQNLQEMGKDLGKAFGTINELQYKLLAMQSVGDFDVKAMDTKANELRLNDFIEASDAEDKAGNFTIAETVQDDSTVIITSTTDEGAGIFRSRIKLADCGNPILIKELAGAKIGTKVKCKLNDMEHEIELLGVRNPPPSAPVEQVEPTVPADTSVN